jgi:hypothetical protein
MMALVRRNMSQHLTKHHNNVIILMHLLVFMKIQTKMLGPGPKIARGIFVRFEQNLNFLSRFFRSTVSKARFDKDREMVVGPSQGDRRRVMTKLMGVFRDLWVRVYKVRILMQREGGHNM